MAGGDSHLQKRSGADPAPELRAKMFSEKDILPPPMAPAFPSLDIPSQDAREDMPEAKARSGDSPTSASSHSTSGEIWLDGEVLACACPGCGAPMSIRLWLRVADCWRCGTSIELTEEQERAAWQLLRQQAAQSPSPPSPDIPPKVPSQPSPSASAPNRSPSPLLPLPPTPKPPPPKGISLPNKSGLADSPWGDRHCTPSRRESALPRERRQTDRNQSAPPAASLAPSQVSGPPAGFSRRRIPAAERAFRQRLQQAQQGRPWHLRMQDWLQNLPAWLISLLLHMAALLLLGLWIPDEGKEKGIVLSSSVGPYDLESELGHQPEIQMDRPEFDEAGVLAFEPLSAKDLLGDPAFQWDSLDPGLHRPWASPMPPNPLIKAPAPARKPGSLFRGRDPSIRNQILYSQGGTTVTEAAVARALRWISRHQNPDGSFSLHAFNRTADCQGQCDGVGTPSDVAGTALALLPMLGAGQTHRQGEYGTVVRVALEWLLARQKKNGDLQDPSLGRMYAHGLASIVLCEAYALTGDSQLRDAAQRALDFIIQAQHPAGGWRYLPGEAGDTSMVGWQLMALNSGRMAGLSVPSETLWKATEYLNSAQTDPAGSKYGYLPGMAASAAMTAEALLCRQYLGWPRNHPGLRGGIRFLLDRHPPDPKQTNIYYWYYATQVFHHYGGPDWERWNDRMRRILVDTQVKKGHAAGSWNPDSAWGTTGGRLFQTALAACTLEVYYRYLPLYRSQAVAQAPETEGTSEAASTSASSSQKSLSALKGGN